MNKIVTIVHYWAGCPKSPNSKWQRFLALVQRCRQEGWKNYLVWSEMPKNPALYEPFRSLDCDIIISPRINKSIDLKSIWMICKLLRRLKCDIFHCHNHHTSPLIGATLAGVPVRIWSKLSMSQYYTENTIPKGLHRFMPSIRISCLCAHRILIISDMVGRELLDAVGFSNKIKTVYGPVDLKRFAIASDGGIRDELNINNSDIVITSVGHAGPVKGWDIAIKAFAQVQKQITKTCLLLVGKCNSSKYFDQLIKLVKEYSLEKSIIFTGKRDDIPQILKSSDIFILSSRSEGMPAALIEAMAAGLPCIASKVGGIPEVITQRKNGLLFERENSLQLAEYLIKLLEDKQERRKLALQASNRAKDFGMETYVKKVFRHYEEILDADFVKNHYYAK